MSPIRINREARRTSICVPKRELNRCSCSRSTGAIHAPPSFTTGAESERMRPQSIDKRLIRC